MLHSLTDGFFSSAVISYGGSPTDGGLPRLVVQRRPSLSPLIDDASTVGVISPRIGPTSHVTAVSRARGIFCAAVSNGVFSEEMLTIDGVDLPEGCTAALTEDGLVTSAGLIRVQRRAITKVRADDCRRLGLRLYCNVNNEREAAMGLAAGATGIGSVRSEHLSLEAGLRSLVVCYVTNLLCGRTTPDSIIREVVSKWIHQLTAVLDQAVAYCAPVAIRLADISLPEWLDDEQLELVEAHGHQADQLRGIVLAEFAWPFYGNLLYAICKAIRRSGIPPREVAVIVPFVSNGGQVAAVSRELPKQAAAAGCEAPPKLGVMIETPAAALQASELARLADWFILGTNDLTALVTGISRDTALALSSGLQVLFEVERLLRIAISEGRRTKPSLTIGVCGESAANSDNLATFAALGVDFVSPVPRLISRNAHDAYAADVGV